MQKKIKILFLYDEPRTFILQDLEILKQNYDIRTLKYNGKKDIPLLILYVLATNLSFSWFALGYASVAVFFSKIFGKKSIVVAGGWDVVNMPEINYGAMQNSKRRRKTKYTLDNADRILAVSESTKENVLYWCHNAKVETVYNGFDCIKYHSLKKDDLVISVGTVSWHTLQLKGIETFVKSACFLPDTTFMLIGPHNDDSIEYLKSFAPSNVIFKCYTPHDELIEFLAKAKVYVQVSAQESFGCALAEAMLCECVPVVTNRGALSEVVGDTGFYVDYNDPRGTAQMIIEALKSNKGSEARHRIKTLYSLDKRKDKVVSIIEELLGK
jgi:glycosyltransferase involved in cell wall biosynthesis